MLFSQALTLATFVSTAFASSLQDGTPTRRSRVDLRRSLERILSPRAAKAPVTNAQRFARGLPPMSPKKATRGGLARRQQASTLPCAAPLDLSSGIIQVYNTGSLIGWIAGNANSITSVFNNAQAFDIGTTTLPQSEILIPFGCNTDPERPYLGFESFGPDLVAGTDNLAYLNTAPASEPDTEPISDPSQGDGAFYESAIWSIACDGSVTATWTNPNGEGPADAVLYFDPANDYIGLASSGDLADFAANEGAFAITMTYVSRDFNGAC